MIQNFFFLQMKIFIISFFFFAKVRHEYQNILCWLFKNHHFRSIWLTVFLQEHFQKAHFNIGHPVLWIGKDNAPRWYVNWRMFFLICSETFAYNDGNDWNVTHYLFSKWNKFFLKKIQKIIRFNEFRSRLWAMAINFCLWGNFW